MHLLFDISAHGLGHLAQSAPVINALQALAPGLELTVRSAIPRERLALRIAGDFRHVAEARDFGLVMHNAVDIDLDASAVRYREFHADWLRRVAAEADWLRAHRVDALVSNVAYLPLAAAAEAGIPACGLSSLNWAEMFAHYLGHEPRAGEIHAQILAAYNAGKAFLRITPGLAMADLPARCDIAPIASIGRRDREQVAKMLDLDESERWLLLAMGGMEFRLPVEDWPPMPGVKWLVPGAWGLERSDVRSIDSRRSGLHRPARQRRCGGEQAGLWHLRRGGLQRCPPALRRPRRLAGDSTFRGLAGEARPGRALESGTPAARRLHRRAGGALADAGTDTPRG
jgi:hypothetical protein